ncbi:MAG: endonuclease/exonuclease/phosphatase family protein [Proteobacteria bacterium]|nr:endonuclease/exonuclease/phosphatase family protein [Pseudomonadota bacterium]
MCLRVATYNIHRGVGWDGVEDYLRIAAVLSEIDADIIALQEVTSHSEKSDDVLAYLAAAVGMVAIEGFTLTAAGARYGNAILSKLPVAFVSLTDISVKGREPRGVIRVDFYLNGQTVVVLATHLGLGIRERHIQTKELLALVNEVESNINVLLGDFNEWFPLGGLLGALGKIFSTYQTPATFPSRRPLLKLDRIWLKPAEKIVSLRTHVTKLSLVASDHLPLVMDISLKRANAHNPRTIIPSRSRGDKSLHEIHF